MVVLLSRGALTPWRNGERNFMKFKKRKCQVLLAGRNNPRHLDRLEAKCLESSSAMKALGILMDTKLPLNQQR